MARTHRAAATTGTAPRPTLESVARATGVSRQTVSNALNAPDLLAPDTRDRVLAAVAELGYRPSRAARQLRTRRSHTLGLRVSRGGDGITGWLLDHFLHALVERAEGEGYHVLVFAGGDDELAGYRELLDGSDVDGVVLTETHHDDPRPAWLTEHGVPFSVFGRPWGTPEAVVGAPRSHAWVDVDSGAGVRDAVAHLAARGHRHIAFLGWPAGSGSGDDRRAGWAAALDAAVPGGAAAARARGHDLAAIDGVESGRAALAPVLEAPDAPSAVVCASDSLAVGAGLAAASTAGTTDGPGRSPVAIVGYDDTPVAAALGLSSVAQPVAEAAQACFDLVLAQLSGDPRAQPTTRLLAPRLVLRASSDRSPPG
jgi:DNA-binding LacI/PurR family transcriptional regulator